MIELTDKHDHTIAEALVSIEDLPRILARGRWHSSKKKNSSTSYCYRGVYSNGKRSNEALHRFIMDAPSDREVDHSDGNGLNNQRGNIRLVTRGQNCQNRGHAGGFNPKSGVRNVHLNKRTGLWQVTVKINGKNTYHGSYSSIEEASVVADTARRALHTHALGNLPQATAGNP